MAKYQHMISALAATFALANCVAREPSNTRSPYQLNEVQLMIVKEAVAYVLKTPIPPNFATSEPSR